MKRLAQWAGRNVDGIVAIVVAAVIAALDVAGDLPSDTVTAGILLVLGALSVAMLHDRASKQGAENAIDRALREISEDVSMVRVLRWPEVSRVLAQARRNTDRWVFRGGTGTYIRAVTLPECVANARRDRRALRIRLEIIDPTNEQVCARYARFRQSLSPPDQGQWTMQRTQRESYATIVACCWHRQRYALLDVTVGLSPIMPTLRWDMSDSSLVITQEDPRKPAIMVEHGKLLYDYFDTELGKGVEQMRQMPLEAAAHRVMLSKDPTVDEIRQLFHALDMPLPASFTDEDVADIVARALHAENPYDS